MYSHCVSFHRWGNWDTQINNLGFTASTSQPGLDPTHLPFQSLAPRPPYYIYFFISPSIQPLPPCFALHSLSCYIQVNTTSGLTSADARTSLFPIPTLLTFSFLLLSLNSTIDHYTYALVHVPWPLLCQSSWLNPNPGKSASPAALHQPCGVASL